MQLRIFLYMFNHIQESHADTDTLGESNTFAGVIFCIGCLSSLIVIGPIISNIIDNGSDHVRL